MATYICAQCSHKSSIYYQTCPMCQGEGYCQGFAEAPKRAAKKTAGGGGGSGGGCLVFLALLGSMPLWARFLM